MTTSRSSLTIRRVASQATAVVGIDAATESLLVGGKKVFPRADVSFRSRASFRDWFGPHDGHVYRFTV